MKLPNPLPTETDTRYADRDLRKNPELLALAVRYARTYTGDWDLMTAARQVVIDSGSLPLPIARTVLNCARTDPRAHCAFLDAGVAHPVAPAPPAAVTVDLYGRNASRTPREPATVTRINRRPAWVDLHATIKPAYTWSIHQSARFYHRLDPERCGLRYYPIRNMYEPRLVNRCGAITASALRTCGKTPPDHLQPCRRCHEESE